MDSTILKKKMYLLDGSFICGIMPYVDIDSIMKHPLWGSNLIFDSEEAVVKCHRDYIKGHYYLYYNNFYRTQNNLVFCDLGFNVLIYEIEIFIFFVYQLNESRKNLIKN